MTEKRYDVAIIGAGISGSMLAAILARQGINTLVLEGGTHPKFAIGESMILETSEIMRSLALAYDVPELAHFSSEHFIPEIGTTHGVKRHFSYVHHREGQPQNCDDVIQAVIPDRPYGHELHLYRQDSDYYYAAIAIKYGADIFQNTPVSDIDITENDVAISTKAGDTYRADYIVDASGFRSLIADKYQLRDHSQQAHSRGIFTHMIEVPSFHQASNTREEMAIPFSVAEGTLHHTFHGGWLWVIPFNNHSEASNPLVSVGLMLDPRIHPCEEDLSPEQEFYQFINRFPDIARQFEGAKAVRNWVRTQRIQYSSHRVVGERYALLGHAAGFIDPLFSKGLYVTGTSIFSLAGALISRFQGKAEYSQIQLEDFEQRSKDYIAANDRLVANAFHSFSEPVLWQQYSVIWILGAYLELVRLTTSRIHLQRHLKAGGKAEDFSLPNLRLLGGGFAPFKILADKVDTLIEAVDVSDTKAVQTAADQMQVLIQAEKWIPYAFREISLGKKHLPTRKFTHRLFLRQGGLLGDKVFRDHFFKDITVFQLSWFMVRERLWFSRAAIARRKQRRECSAY